MPGAAAAAAAAGAGSAFCVGVLVLVLDWGFPLIDCVWGLCLQSRDLAADIPLCHGIRESGSGVANALALYQRCSVVPPRDVGCIAALHQRLVLVAAT